MNFDNYMTMLLSSFLGKISKSLVSYRRKRKHPRYAPARSALRSAVKSSLSEISTIFSEPSGKRVVDYRYPENTVGQTPDIRNFGFIGQQLIKIIDKFSFVYYLS